jgi:hypothetical protein
MYLLNLSPLHYSMPFCLILATPFGPAQAEIPSDIAQIATGRVILKAPIEKYPSKNRTY